jgi:hypothetical protein
MRDIRVKIEQILPIHWGFVQKCSQSRQFGYVSLADPAAQNVRIGGIPVRPSGAA